MTLLLLLLRITAPSTPTDRLLLKAEVVEENSCDHQKISSCLSKEVSYYWIVHAGLAAYSSWMPTVKLLLQSKELPCFFTDYCEEAAERAAHMCRAISRNSRGIEVVLNPWRSPLRDTRAGTALPSCSNAFVVSASWCVRHVASTQR